MNYEINNVITPKVGYSVHMSEHEPQSFIAIQKINKRIELGLKTYSEKTVVLCDLEQWQKWFDKYCSHLNFTFVEANIGIVYDEDNNFFVFTVVSGHASIKVYGEFDWVKKLVKQLENDFEQLVSKVNWVFTQEGHVSTVPLNTSRLPVKEMYPFLGERSLEDYYDSFMKSDANILLLIGAPGTGKTTFIRGLLNHTKSSAMVSYDSSILEKDVIFAHFIEGDCSVMVLEDSDNFLRPRSDGNTMMHKFLNVGDGLVTTKEKKLIFSTNLPSIRDVDPALTRPGRCFDVLEFSQLNYDQATLLSKKLGVELQDSKEYSIAEIFGDSNHKENLSKTNKRFGFI